VYTQTVSLDLAVVDPVRVKTKSESESESDFDSGPDFDMAPLAIPAPAPTPFSARPSIVAAKKSSFSIFRSKKKAPDAASREPVPLASSNEVKISSEEDATSDEESDNDGESDRCEDSGCYGARN